MKKLLSMILCVILLCSVFVTSVSAATNYCDLFQSHVRSLRWSLELNGYNSVAEGQEFPTIVMMDYIKMKIMDDYVDETHEYSRIPASVFETKVKKCFAVVDVNKLRSFEEDFWNVEIDGMDKRKIYDEATNTYVFIAAGGVGDSATYAISGYIKKGSKYTVYSHFIDLSEEGEEVTGVEGKDYFVYEGQKYKIYHSLKNVVETDGTDVKFHSWQQVSSVPSASEMITPSTKVEDPVTSTPSSNTQSSKPTESKPTASTPATSKPEENTATSSETTTSSDTTSATDEEKPLVTVAKTDTAKLETEENVFPEDTVVKVEEIKETEKIDTIKVALKEVSEKFVAYEITAECKNVSVQPDGKVKATFNIPDGYDLNKVAVFYVADNGNTEKLTSSVDKDSKTVVAELTHFSTYVVAETNTVQIPKESVGTTGASEDENTEKGGALLWIIIAVAVIIIAGGAVAYIFIFKKKA